MRKPNSEKERKGNKQRETTVGRNGEEFGKNGWYGEGLAHEGERRGLRVWQAEQGVHTYPERPTGWGWWSPSRAARLCVAAGWRWRERRGGGLERELKGGKGRRENERGEARRAREASVVSVRPLWRSRQDCVGPHLFLLSLPPPPDPHHRLPSRPPSHNQPPPLPSRHHLARPPPFAPLCVSSPLCVSRAHPSPHPRLCFVFYASPPYPSYPPQLAYPFRRRFFSLLTFQPWKRRFSVCFSPHSVFLHRHSPPFIEQDAFPPSPFSSRTACKHVCVPG